MNDSVPCHVGRHLRWGVLVLTLFSMIGCSGERRQVIQGKVSCKGVPLSSGVVRIHGPGDRLVSALVQGDGTFTATDVFPGIVTVTVAEDPVAGRSLSPAAGFGPGKKTPKEQQPTPKKIVIPTQYQNAKTSELTYTITPTTTWLDITLE